MIDHRFDAPLADGQSVIDHVRTTTHSALEADTVRQGHADIAIWEQGDDAFTTPPMNTHFLALVLGGSAVAEIDFDACSGARQARLGAGGLCYVPAGNATSVVFDGRFRTLHIMVPADLFDAARVEMAQQMGCPGVATGFVNERNPAIAAACLALATAEAGPGGALARSGLEHALVQKLVRYVSPVSGGGQKTPEMLSDVQLKQAVDYIETRVFEEFDLAAVARFVGASVPALVRSFEDEVGTSPARFRTQRQIDHALSSLDQDAAASSWEVARRVGFESVDALDMAFRTEMGIGFENYRLGAYV